jgi:competence protein CoiA
MKYALRDGEKVEATKGAKGICPVCKRPVNAKTGERRAWHWAHQSNSDCDHWWESETEWHRNWKNNYPQEWQEVVLVDSESGEKHIADIRTPDNLVIEFQHSPIEPEERFSREKFYKNMVWVVDGTKLKRWYPNFIKGKNEMFFRPTGDQDVFLVDYPDRVFPSDWLESSVPVVFDFLGFPAKGGNETKNSLWCLMPIQEGKTFAVRLDREEFISRTKKFPSSTPPIVKQITPHRLNVRSIRGKNANIRGSRIDLIENRRYSKRRKSKSRRNRVR